MLLLNQCFYPDHVATAQYLTDLAIGLVESGHEVTVVASSRGYDQPEKRYPRRENWRGIEIRRIWTAGLGKSAKWRRMVDFGMFWLSATVTLLRVPRHDVTVCLTSPPLISSLGTLMAWIKGGKVMPWIMDLNPDEAVAAGWLKAGGLPERLMSGLQGWSFRRAARIIALDRFMARRLLSKGVKEEQIHVDPPWAQDSALRHDAEAGRAFREEHGLGEKFIVMYSGNHSPCHPLDTLLQAALRLVNEQEIHFLFVGGGSEFAKVKAFRVEHSLANITWLPYVPIEKLSGSLSAADLHVVVMGNAFVGIIHPCKIYNILAIGLPFLSICPRECHLVDLMHEITDKRYAYEARHDDVEAVREHILTAANRRLKEPCQELRDLASRYSISVLRPRLVEIITAA